MASYIILQINVDKYLATAYAKCCARNEGDNLDLVLVVGELRVW